MLEQTYENTENLTFSLFLFVLLKYLYMLNRKHDWSTFQHPPSPLYRTGVTKRCSSFLHALRNYSDGRHSHSPCELVNSYERLHIRNVVQAWTLAEPMSKKAFWFVFWVVETAASNILPLQVSSKDKVTASDHQHTWFGLPIHINSALLFCGWYLSYVYETWKCIMIP